MRASVGYLDKGVFRDRVSWWHNARQLPPWPSDAAARLGFKIQRMLRISHPQISQGRRSIYVLKCQRVSRYLIMEVLPDVDGLIQRKRIPQSHWLARLNCDI